MTRLDQSFFTAIPEDGAPRRQIPEVRRRGDTPDPIDIHVGTRLRLRRHMIGLSQEQLGKATGLTFQQIQKYERGTNRMGASRLFQIAAILSVPVSWFFEEIGGRTAQATGFAESKQTPIEGHASETPTENHDWMQHRESLELIRAYWRIRDTRKRRSVFDLIRALADQPQTLGSDATKVLSSLPNEEDDTIDQKDIA